VHAEVLHREDGWYVRDAGSRNGTFVNEKKIDEAKLLDGDRLKLGITEFVFHETLDLPTRATSADIENLETIVKEAAINPEDSNQILISAIERGEFAHDLMVLYQLSMKLLGFDNPHDVIQASVDLLRNRTKASVAGFLWRNDDGQLRTTLILPESGEKISISQSLTDVVCQQGRAVWTSNQRAAGPTQSLRPYSDAMCVPVVHDGTTIAAIHLYLRNGRFRNADFDFAISVANLLSVALVRTRQQATLVADHARLMANSATFDDLIGQSPPMLELKQRISRVARASGCVLIRGESGVGKELVARALHKASQRVDRPMLSVNCAAIPSELIESQLFGHKKGAFTSADSNHDGWFKQADTGTLFLDEIGELPLEGQAKLLRILEGHPFLPVGGTTEISVDVRVIAATNRDLKEFVKERRFRDDLYYRLTVFELEVPALRDRGTDIGLLIDHFLAHFRTQHGRPDLRLAKSAREKLLAYSWPGNVRQLRNVIDSAVVLASDGSIEPADLGLRSAISDELQTLRISDWEQKLIKDALKRTGGRIPEAAQLLGIGRATLYRKLEEYAISR
jgi:Nif-specific regulatory protein